MTRNIRITAIGRERMDRTISTDMLPRGSFFVYYIKYVINYCRVLKYIKEEIQRVTC